MNTIEEQSDDRVKVRIEDGIARVSLNRPERHNSLDMSLIRALLDTVGELRGAPGLRVVILFGEGASFCSGLDVAGVMADPANVQWLLGKHPDASHNRVQHLALGWRSLPVPVIASITGHAYGGGLQLAMGADLRIAHPDSKLSVMEGRWGIIPDMGLSVTARGRVREDLLMRMTMTAEVFSGEQARDLGLVTETSTTPLARAEELALHIRGMSPDMIAAAKTLFRDSRGLDDNDRLAMEEALQKRLLGTANQLEAVMARMEKRAPSFSVG